MRNSKCRNGAGRTRLACVALAALALASCGGPYTPKRTGIAGDKLSIADGLFARGKYGDAAIEYRHFLTTFAGDERSDYAQFRLAESLRMDKEYASAEVEYRILVNDFGYSQYVDDAFYLEGLCAFEQAPRAERDQSKSYEALNRIERFLQLFPSSDRAGEARATLREVHERLGRKEFLNARLYFSRKAYDAALIYLDKVIDFYPETVWAARSRFYRGYIRELRSETAGAAEDYRRVLAANGDVPEKSRAARRLEGMRKQEGGAKPDVSGAK